MNILCKLEKKNKEDTKFWIFVIFNETFLEQWMWTCKWVSWRCHRLTIFYLFCSQKWQKEMFQEMFHWKLWKFKISYYFLSDLHQIFTVLFEMFYSLYWINLNMDWISPLSLVWAEFKVYLYPKLAVWYVKGTHFNSQFHQHLEEKICCKVLETWNKTTRSPGCHNHTTWYRSNIYACVIGSCVRN